MPPGAVCVMRAGRAWCAARRVVAAALACVVMVSAAKVPVLRAQPVAEADGAATRRGAVSSQPPPLAREFRGVWVASVSNIDWPSRRTLSTAEQQAELIALLDRAAAMRLNAVIFQVRPSGDALYESALEPWSEYLTGVQGRAPSPAWDPLAFAVKEAHARHLELHAWFNPYRARHVDSRSPFAANHLARRQPSLVKRYGRSMWMDPGEPAVRAQTLRVVLDVVARYDVDGVHIDDYFYPYPERTRRGRVIPFPDDASWRRYRQRGGTLARDDWRRENVNTLVRELAEGIHRTKPWVRFGVSPFGIWRPGFPESVRGFDAYAQLYADARKWLREGWVDYFTPQLYWPTTREGQAYPVLLDWWAGENVLKRHLWPGNFTSLAGGRGSTAFPVSELVEQIRVTRRNEGATGNVHFSMKSFLTNQAGMVDVLAAGPYAEPALVPATPWLAVPAPPLPAPQWRADRGVAELRLGHRGPAAPWQWLVRLRTDSGWVSMMVPGSVERWTVPGTRAPSAVAVSALNRVGSESDAVLLEVPNTSNAPASSLAPTAAPSTVNRGRRHER